MNILELHQQFEDNIRIAEKDKDGGAAVRLMTVYKHTLLHLIETGKVSMSDDESAFWHYPKSFSTGALYKVAQAQRKRSHLPPLNYPQKTYKE